jgi:dipeptidyl aminopeptidase/acylaminoacyl peptidase
VSRYPVLKKETGGDYQYIADREGKLAFGCKIQDGHLSLHQLVGDTWQQCPEDLEEIAVFDAGDNPGEIVVRGERKDGKPRPLEVMDATSGKVLNVLWQDPAYDFNGWLYRDPKTNRILGAIGEKSGPYSVWFDEGMRNLQKTLDKMFPGQVVRIIGNDEAGKVFLIVTFSDRQPPIYSLVDLEKHTAGMFKNPMPWIDPQRMQPMGVMKFKTRDGKQFDAYVTLPKGATKQNPPPLVVLLHNNGAPEGGYFVNDTWGFNAEVQFLASRGYAVLQPNYRSSPGCSWMYPEADEWAFRKMHEDVTDATKALIATGLVDRNRVAISGIRFGGYLALCGVAFEPSLYRCAVAVSPVCDYGKLMEDQKYFKNRSPYYARMCLKLGDPKNDPERFSAMSPLKHADDIRVPVLISEGEYDQSVELGMAADLVSAVKQKGIPAESIKFLNESAGVRDLDHRVELFERIESFLAKNMGAGAP